MLKPSSAVHLGAAALLATFLLAGTAGARSPQIGFDENLGENVPLDITLRDEQGNEITLEEAIQGPTVLALVYFTCPGICTPMLNSMVHLVNRTPLEPGEDFRVITVSFDPRDTSAVALEKKQNYRRQVKRPFPADHWMFLTGDQENVRRLTEAVGFRYEKRDQMYDHPAGLIVLSPSGRIARYLPGLDFQPFDLKMALTEASEERSGPTIRKALLLCFSYDPESRRYVANVTRIGATVTLLLAGMLAAFVLFRSRRRHRGEEEPSEEGNGNG